MTAVAEPKKVTKPKRQPPYHVLLHDDNDHSFEYVIRMLKSLFQFSEEKGMQIAKAVDEFGEAICITTTREHAEFKRDQIHSYGKDRELNNSRGSMRASIEPAE